MTIEQLDAYLAEPGHLTRAMVLEQCAEVRISEAQLNSMTIPQRTALIHACAYARAARAVERFHGIQIAEAAARIRALEGSIMP